MAKRVDWWAKWVLIFDGGAGAGTDAWSDLVTHLKGKNIYIYNQKTCFNVD